MELTEALLVIVGVIVITVAVDALIAQTLVWGFQANHIYPSIWGVYLLTTGVSGLLITNRKNS